MARIVALVEEASATKASTQLFIEKVEQRYSVGVVTATLALFVVPLLLGAALQPTLLRAMTFMIVASPCAVVLATMPPLLAAIANAGRHGVLVKSAVVMEQLGAITARRVRQDRHPHRRAPRGSPTSGCCPAAASTDDELLALAAAAERPSEHPLAAAVVAAARERGLPLAARRRVHLRARARRHAPSSTGARRRSARPALLAELPTAGTPPRWRRCCEADGRHRGRRPRRRRRPPACWRWPTSSARRRRHRRGADRAHRRGPVLLTGDNAARRAPARRRGRHHRRPRRAAARRTRSTAVHGAAGRRPPGAARRRRRQRRPRAGRRRHRDRDGPARLRPRAGHRRRGHRPRRPRHPPAVIALSRRARRVVIANLVIAATVITVLVLWDLLGHLPLPLGRRRPRRIHRHRRPQRPAPPGSTSLDPSQYRAPVNLQVRAVI